MSYFSVGENGQLFWGKVSVAFCNNFWCMHLQWLSNFERRIVVRKLQKSREREKEREREREREKEKHCSKIIEFKSTLFNPPNDVCNYIHLYMIWIPQNSWVNMGTFIILGWLSAQVDHLLWKVWRKLG